MRLRNERTGCNLRSHVSHTANLQMWGGVECTINRVHDTFFSQLTLNGHLERVESDLDLFKDIGITALRTSLHWERSDAPESWHLWDHLLGEMSLRQMTPIVGLLHHGSGPPSTDLLDPAFPERLAQHARFVAERYPHVLDYTPVNEPQTTGRFSCLYGFWYPHHRSMPSYVRSLHNQLKGVGLSMQAIRDIQPEARLIHTEDAGATYSTPQLEPFRQQREHRRWLGTDLLTGVVDRRHPLFSFLIENGLTEREIFWFVENPCPPSVLGLNYYVTSDRFLDHRTDLYPFLPGGDTGDEPLVDTEAVRVRPEGITGVRTILHQAWERYKLPLAITECHLGCHALEQVRWLAEVWGDTCQARAEGVDVRAVTLWALLGSFNWSNLCTRPDGLYEPGIFELTDGVPRPTPLGMAAERLARNLPLEPLATEPGWWRRADRLIIPTPGPPVAESESSEYAMQ